MGKIATGASLVTYIVTELEGRDYYADTAYEFIEEAVEDTLKEWGVQGAEYSEKFIDEVDEYIQENLI